MSLPRLFNYGNKFLDNFCHSLQVFKGIRVEKMNIPQRNFFSYFCHSNRFVECSKLKLKSYSPLIIHSQGLKIRGNLQLRCKDCYFERKDGVMYVMCSSYPRHKQKALTPRLKYTWILTSCCQSKKRPY